MTTIVDPTGTPVPVYNKSGTTISEITIDMSVATIEDVPAPSSHTILVATVIPGPLTTDRGPRLPGGADVGDTVEIYVVGIEQYIVHAPIGEGLIRSSEGPDPALSVRSNNRFTKVSPTAWVIFSGSY